MGSNNFKLSFETLISEMIRQGAKLKHVKWCLRKAYGRNFIF